MRRGIGILVGIGTHALFAWTVYRLFLFLHGSSQGYLTHWARATDSPWFVGDALLALQFVIPHSWLLHPATRSRLEKWIPAEFYGCFFCLVTCVCLLTTIEFWQPCSAAVWRLHRMPAVAVRLAFLAWWPALIYSLSLTGLGYQTGLTPWLAWLRKRRAPRRVFQPRGAYRFLRHPVYLSFLGLIWCTPTMTFDHALLTGVWTTYIFIGSWLKDRRLHSYIGEPYRTYQERVPGYPLMPIGPLARLPRPRLIENRLASPPTDRPRRMAA